MCYLKAPNIFATGDPAILTRQLMCFLLEKIQEKGWNILMTLDISWKEKDKSLFILEK
jgi:hypothetical protein